MINASLTKEYYENMSQTKNVFRVYKLDHVLFKKILSLELISFLLAALSCLQANNTYIERAFNNTFYLCYNLELLVSQDLQKIDMSHIPMSTFLNG